MKCWGVDEAGATEAPAGPFTAVSSGTQHSCGLRPDGILECWGSDENGQSSPPGSMFILVDAGGLHSCGLRPDSSVECWGSDDFDQASPPPGEFASISVGWVTTAVCAGMVLWNAGAAVPMHRTDFRRTGSPR